VERQIDEEVYRLYGIGTADRAAIEAELAGPSMSIEVADGEAAESAPAEEVAVEAPASREELARRWVAYAAGIVLGRFRPGEEGALGRGSFSAEVAAGLHEIHIASGLAPLDAGHPDDLAARVEQALALMLGEAGLAEVVAALGGDAHDPRGSLRRYVAGDFFKQHVQRYRKRPIYWLLQSPKRDYSLYLFHERVTRDTLYSIQGPRYLGGKLNQTRLRIAELAAAGTAAQGAEQRRLRRERDDLEKALSDLEAFAQRLAAIASARNERGETVGWAPEPDDGVILNLAPLHTIVPAWSSEPRKHWERLEAGDFDWSHTAMRYWPDRVAAKCRSDKSYAIAHGRGDLYRG